MLAARTLRAAVATLAVLALAACGQAQTPTTSANASDSPSANEPTTVTVTTAQGDVEVPFNPERVVVIEHGILDTIDALGLGGQVAGIPHHALPAHLASYTETVTNVGTLFEPDFEAINALDPDLIIVGGRSVAALSDLQGIATTIDLSFDWVNVSASVAANTTAIGTIFGVEEQAQAELDALTAAIADAASNIEGAGNALVVMASGGALSAYGPGSRFDFVYDEFGLTAAADEVAIADHGDTISFEFIAQVNPDSIIVLDRDAVIGEAGNAGAAELLNNALVNGTSAATSGRIVYVTTDAWYLSFGGLTAMNIIVADLNGLSS